MYFFSRASQSGHLFSGILSVSYPLASESSSETVSQVGAILMTGIWESSYFCLGHRLQVMVYDDFYDHPGFCPVLFRYHQI